jgi:hypothetical protein
VIVIRFLRILLLLQKNIMNSILGHDTVTFQSSQRKLGSSCHPANAFDAGSRDF